MRVVRLRNEEKSMLQAKWFIGAAVASTILVAIAVPSMAEEDAKTTQTTAREMQLLKDARIGMAEAIQVAEREAKGKAVASSIDDENGVNYEIEVMAPDGKLTDILVDPKSGTVVKTAAAEKSDDEANKGLESEDEGDMENAEDD
jgi:uncharacterized membrane protein YkoI